MTDSWDVLPKNPYRRKPHPCDCVCAWIHTDNAIEDTSYLDLASQTSGDPCRDGKPIVLSLASWTDEWASCRGSALSSPPCLLSAFWLADNHEYTSRWRALMRGDNCQTNLSSRHSKLCRFLKYYSMCLYIACLFPVFDSLNEAFDWN